ncbi:MAG: NERD domain-containing protein, partial [Oscillospiraceae bacterium]|nr:NERD domain-containing protein [Oscillospiraceae bacterium]
KHYKGAIYGKNSDERWTQYFRTQKNETFFNPIKQNQYHIEAIKNLFPNAKVFSFIVFTNEECELYIDNEIEDISVCTLTDMKNIITTKIMDENIYDMDGIDGIFNSLLVYAPVMQKKVKVDAKEEPLNHYINNFAEEYQTKKIELDNRYNLKNKKLEDEYNSKEIELESLYYSKEKSVKNKFKKYTILVISSAFIICLICILFSVFKVKNSNMKRITAEMELAEFAKKFEYVDTFNNGNIELTEDIAYVSELTFEDSASISNAVNFSCVLKHSGSNYGVAFTDNSKITVILKDGRVKEYDIFNEIYQFYGKHYLINYVGKENAEILPHELFGIKKEEVKYIKISNLELVSTINSNNWIILADNYEIEIYSE